VLMLSGQPAPPVIDILFTIVTASSRPEVDADYLMALSEGDLKFILREFIRHYNRGRPHSALGPGFPEPIKTPDPASGHRHRLLQPTCRSTGTRTK